MLHEFKDQVIFETDEVLTQSERFDAEGKFIKRYLPELAALPAKYIHAPWLLPAELQRTYGVTIGMDYPVPIVDHAAARAVTLALFKTGR